MSSYNISINNINSNINNNSFNNSNKDSISQRKLTIKSTKSNMSKFNSSVKKQALFNLSATNLNSIANINKSKSKSKYTSESNLISNFHIFPNNSNNKSFKIKNNNNSVKIVSNNINCNENNKTLPISITHIKQKSNNSVKSVKTAKSVGSAKSSRSIREKNTTSNNNNNIFLSNNNILNIFPRKSILHSLDTCKNLTDVNLITNILENKKKKNENCNLKKVYNPQYVENIDYLAYKITSGDQELQAIERNFRINQKAKMNLGSVSSKQVIDSLYTSSKNRGNKNFSSCNINIYNNVNIGKRDNEVVVDEESIMDDNNNDNDNKIVVNTGDNKFNCLSAYYSLDFKKYNTSSSQLNKVKYFNGNNNNSNMIRIKNIDLTKLPALESQMSSNNNRFRNNTSKNVILNNNKNSMINSNRFNSIITENTNKEDIRPIKNNFIKNYNASSFNVNNNNLNSFRKLFPRENQNYLNTKSNNNSNTNSNNTNIRNNNTSINLVHYKLNNNTNKLSNIKFKFSIKNNNTNNTNNITNIGNSKSNNNIISSILNINNINNNINNVDNKNIIYASNKHNYFKYIPPAKDELKEEEYYNVPLESIEKDDIKKIVNNLSDQSPFFKLNKEQLAIYKDSTKIRFLNINPVKTELYIDNYMNNYTSNTGGNRKTKNNINIKATTDENHNDKLNNGKLAKNIKSNNFLLTQKKESLYNDIENRFKSSRFNKKSNYCSSENSSKSRSDEKNRVIGAVIRESMKRIRRLNLHNSDESEINIEYDVNSEKRNKGSLYYNINSNINTYPNANEDEIKKYYNKTFSKLGLYEKTKIGIKLSSSNVRNNSKIKIHNNVLKEEEAMNLANKDSKVFGDNNKNTSNYYSLQTYSPEFEFNNNDTKNKKIISHKNNKTNAMSIISSKENTNGFDFRNNTFYYTKNNNNSTIRNSTYNSTINHGNKTRFYNNDNNSEVNNLDIERYNQAKNLLNKLLVKK